MKMTVRGWLIRVTSLLALCRSWRWKSSPEASKSIPFPAEHSPPWHTPAPSFGLILLFEMHLFPGLFCLFEMHFPVTSPEFCVLDTPHLQGILTFQVRKAASSMEVRDTYQHKKTETLQRHGDRPAPTGMVRMKAPAGQWTVIIRNCGCQPWAGG